MRVARPALGLAPQVADVAEHLRQRHERRDDPGAGPLLHGLDLAAAGVEVADDVTHVVLGRGDLDGHHRLEQHRVGLAGRLLERHRAGDLEGELGRVDVVVGAVVQGDLDVDQRVAGEDAELHGLLGARVDRRDVLPRDAATGDLVHELVAAVAARRSARCRSAPWRTGRSHRSASCGCSRPSRPCGGWSRGRRPAACRRWPRPGTRASSGRPGPRGAARPCRR